MHAIHHLEAPASSDPPPGLPGREEEDDAHESKEGAGHLAPTDALLGDHDPQGKGDDQAQRTHRLDHHQRRPVQGCGLEDPSDGLGPGPEQPEWLTQALEEETGIILGSLGLQCAPLLEDTADGKGEGRSEGQPRARQSPGPGRGGRGWAPSEDAPWAEVGAAGTDRGGPASSRVLNFTALVAATAPVWRGTAMTNINKPTTKRLRMPRSTIPNLPNR